MKKFLKLCGFIVATSFLFVIIASLAFYYLVRVGEFRRFLVSQLEQQTEFKVQLGEADLEIGWISGIAFRDLALSEPAAAQPLIVAERITARVALLPLLQRKLIFYEVRLFKPTAQIVRDKDGRIPLLDKFLNLPFLKEQNSEFQFDLRSIKVQKGQIEWIDQRTQGAPVTFRLRDVDADVERVRGRRLREFMQNLLKAEKNKPLGPALQFTLKGTLEKDAKQTRVSANGRLVSLEEVLKFRSSWWSADIELVDVPANLLLHYSGRRIPLESISGYFAQHVRVEGRPSESLHFTGDLEFRQLGIDAPELYAAPLTLGDGRASFAIDWSPQRIALSQLNFRSDEVKFSMQGEIRSLDRNDPHFQLNFSSLPMPITALQKLIPVKLVASSQLENLVASLQEGELYLKKAGLNASLSEMRRWVETGIKEHIWFEAELRNVGIRLDTKEALPLRGVQGHIILRKGVIVFTGGEASYGRSRLSSVNGTYAPDEREFTLHAWGDLELAELREQLKLGIYTTEATTMASSLQELGGRARGHLSLRLVKDAPSQMQGKLALDSARLRKDDLSLTDLTGDLVFTAREIKGERIKGLISGSPIQINLLLKDYGSVDGMFDLRVDSTGIKAGALTRLLLSSGSIQDPGIVRGAVRYQGSLSDKENRKLTGTVDLINVQLTTQPLLQPIRELNGKIKIDETGIDFQNLQGLLVGLPSSVNGRWRYAEKPQLIFDFAAPNLDITYLLSQVDAESSDFYANLQAQGRIALAKGKIKDLEFGGLKTAVTLDRRVWRLTDLTARVAGGGTAQGVTIITDRPDTLGITADSKIQGVPVQSFLRWFDMTTTEMTGRVNMSGSLQTNGNDDAERKRNLSGVFNLEIEDGTIHRMRIVVQILNLLDLSRWFTLQLPDLAKQGIRFRKITGDFKVDKGVYRTENLLVDSDDLRMTGAGKIDVSKDEVEFVVAVRPFAGIDSAIHHIPLLGRGIAAIKNSFLVASFNIKGPIEDPTITPAPLGTLSEWFWGVLGIPKNLIGLGDGEKKNEIMAPPK